MPKRKYPILHENDLISNDVKWVDLPGFEENYLVSENGDVVSKQRVNVLESGATRIQSARRIKPSLKKNGYVYVTLCKKGKSETKRLHRLVAQAFIPNQNNLEQVNHIDGNKSNNKVSNLEWCSKSQNVQHAYDNNLINHYSREVLKICSGKIIDTFPSLKKAAESISGKNILSVRHCIYLCCNNKLSSAYGYEWKYKSNR